MPGYLVVTAGALVLAWLPAGAAAAPEKHDILLVVGAKTTLYYLPLTVAERKGYFRDESLNVEIADFSGDAKALQALKGRSADVVSGAFEHTIVMQTNAITLRALQGMNPGFELGIVKAKAASYEWPKDLKGWRVGVSAPGSSTHMLVNHLPASVALTPDDVSILGVGTRRIAVATVRGRHLDALSGVEPVRALLVKSGDIKIVTETITDKGTFNVFGGSMPAATLYARKSFIEEHPNTAQALTNAMVRALKCLQKTTPDDIAQVVPPEYLRGDCELYLVSYNRLCNTYSKDGRIPAKAVDNSHKVLLQHNYAVRRAPLLHVKESFTNAFVERALKQFS